MVIAESYKFAMGFAQFSKTFSSALYEYLAKGKLPNRNDLKGTNLNTTLPDNLPTVVEIKRVIPQICFQPRVSTSMYYAIKDITLIIICYFFFSYLINLTSNLLFQLPLMVAYWAIQGTLFTGIFVVGHDCGHGSFSNYPLLNDVVGSVMHSFLMAPYYMWMLTHRQHHKNTGNLDKDEVFYPVRESAPTAKSRALPGFGLGLGWYGYLMTGYQPRPVCHFNIRHPMFAKHVLGCVFSLIGMSVMSLALYKFYTSYGFIALVCYYVVPDFIFASFCVIITFLQHSELNIPWYSDEQWDFVRGQLSTVDRHYGPVHSVIHNIGTHQMHHMFPKIPHYHLELATGHFRKKFPELVKTCDEPIMTSFFRMFRVYDSNGVVPDQAQVFYYDQ